MITCGITERTAVREKRPLPLSDAVYPHGVPAAEGGSMTKIVDAVSAGTVFMMNLPVPTARPRLLETDLDEVRSHLEPGDVLLIGDDNYPGWLLMQRLLYGADYAHTAMYAGNQEVIDADAGRGVTRHPLNDLMEGHRLQVLRPGYRTGADRQAALDYCEKQKGKPFDPLFDTGDNNAL